MPLRIHCLSIHGPFPSHYAPVYTSPFYMQVISISLCPCIHPTVYTQVYLLHLELRIHTLGCICRVIHSTNCSAYMPNSIYSGIFITLRTPHIYLGVYSDTERDGIEMWQTWHDITAHCLKYCAMRSYATKQIKNKSIHSVQLKSLAVLGLFVYGFHPFSHISC